MANTMEFEVPSKYLEIPLPRLPDLESSMADFLRESYKPEVVFSYADRKWHEAYLPGQLAEVVKILLEIDTAKNSGVQNAFQPILTELKELRRTGTRRVDCWKMIDANHSAPYEFEVVVSAIGEFKDTVWFLDKAKRSPDKLTERMNTLIRKPERGFQPADLESFMETYNQYLKDIRTILDLESPTLEEHHRLRRRLRTLRHYFTLVECATGDKTAKAFSDYLEPISVEMGKAQDQIFVLETDGKVDVHSDKTQIQTRHREHIEAFLLLHK